MSRTEIFENIIRNVGVYCENGNRMETLVTHNSDGADFANLSKWQIERMLNQAYDAGRHRA